MIWALLFAFIAVVAGIFGFSGFSAAGAVFAKGFFFTALAMFVVFLALALLTEKKLTPE